jgi:hypothetical protein
MYEGSEWANLKGRDCFEDIGVTEMYITVIEFNGMRWIYMA